jgi:hypothetical protein
MKKLAVRQVSRLLAGCAAVFALIVKPVLGCPEIPAELLRKQSGYQ